MQRGGAERTGARLSRDERIYLRAQLKAAARASLAAPAPDSAEG